MRSLREVGQSLSMENKTTGEGEKWSNKDKQTSAKRCSSLAKEKGCQFVDLKFIDLARHLAALHPAHHRAQRRRFSRKGNGFDGSSIRGFRPSTRATCCSLPDPDTAIIDPILEPPP